MDVLNLHYFNSFSVAFYFFTFLGIIGQRTSQSLQLYSQLESQLITPDNNDTETDDTDTDDTDDLENDYNDTDVDNKIITTSDVESTKSNILFLGTSQLHRPCDYILYRILQLPLQQFEYGKSRKNGSEFEITEKYLEVFHTATNRLLLTEYTVGDLVCDTRGHPIGFQTPLHCSNVTKRCECLVINDLHTEQPFGVVGCLGVKGSYCIPQKLECGFGYDCVDEVCEGIGHVLKPKFQVISSLLAILHLIPALFLQKIDDFF